MTIDTANLREEVLQKIKAKRLFTPELASAEPDITAVEPQPLASAMPEPAKIGPPPESNLEKFLKFESTVPVYVIKKTRESVDEVLGLLRKARDKVLTGLPPAPIKNQDIITQTRNIVENFLRGGVATVLQTPEFIDTAIRSGFAKAAEKVGLPKTQEQPNMSEQLLGSMDRFVQDPMSLAEEDPEAFFVAVTLSKSMATGGVSERPLPPKIKKSVDLGAKVYDNFFAEEPKTLSGDTYRFEGLQGFPGRDPYVLLTNMRTKSSGVYPEATINQIINPGELKISLEKVGGKAQAIPKPETPKMRPMEKKLPSRLTPEEKEIYNLTKAATESLDRMQGKDRIPFEFTPEGQKVKKLSESFAKSEIPPEDLPSTLQSFPALTGLKALENSVNRFWAEKIGIPLTRRFNDWIESREPIARIKKYMIDSIDEANPQLARLLREREGFINEFIGLTRRNAEITEELKKRLPDEITGIIQGQEKTVKIAAKTKETRLTQLLEQRTVPEGKLPKGPVPKAGVSTLLKPEDLKLIEEYQTNTAKIGLEGVKVGLIEPDTYLRNMGAYLHREFAQKVRKLGIFPYKIIKFRGGEFKQRGEAAIQIEIKRLEKEIILLDKNVNQLQLSIQKSIDRNVAKIQKAISRYKERIGRVSGLESVVKQATIADYEQTIKDIRNIDIKEFPDPTIKAIKKEIQILQNMQESANMRVDNPLDVQLREGLISDPTIRTVKGGMESTFDIANFKIMPEIFRGTDQRGPWKVNSPQDGYVQVNKPLNLPAQTWKKIADVNKADHPVYLRSDIYKETMDLIGQKHAFVKGYQSFVGFMKKNFTTRTGIQFALLNFFGNPMFVSMGQGSVLRYSRTVKEMMADSPEIKPYVDALRKSGDLSDVVYMQEMAKYLPDTPRNVHWFTGWIQALDRFADEVTRLSPTNLGISQDFWNRLATITDQAVKVELYRSGIERGLSHQGALINMRKFSPSPARLSRFLKLPQRTGIPLFISYPMETLRIFKNSARENPIALTKWLATPFLIQEIVKNSQNISDDEWDAGVKLLPTWRRRWWIPKIAVRQDNGDLQFYDMSNLFPWTSFTGVVTNFRGIGSIPQINFALEIAQGRSSDTGKPIFRLSERVPDEQLLGVEYKTILNEIKAYADRVSRDVLIGVNYSNLKALIQYWQKKPRPATGEPYDIGELLFRALPVKLDRITKGTVELQRGLKLGEIKELQKEEARVVFESVDKKITPEQRREKLRRLRIQINEILKDYTGIKHPSVFRSAPAESIGVIP